MSSFYEVFNRVIQPYKTMILIIFLAILFGVVGFFIYTNFIANMIKDRKFTDVANTTGKKETIIIYFFFADWCPHCKTAKPEWEKFSKNVNGTIVNNKTIQTMEVDCTDMDSSNTSNPDVVNTIQMVKQYEVKGFPTVLAVKDNKKVDYDAKVSLTTLNKYIEALTQ
jgi:thiol-disulfide isomerase/thioredoxin